MRLLNRSSNARARLSLLALASSLLGTATAGALPRFSVATGDWSSASTWAATSGGVPGASAPLAGDAVTIEGNFTVTVSADAACASITFTTATAITATLSVNPGVTLSVAGAITIPRTSTSGMNTLAVGAGNVNAASVAFTNGGGTSRHRITISTGTLAVSGNITQSGSSTSAVIAFSNAGTLRAGGSFLSSSTGVLTLGSGCTVVYSGAAQTVGNFVYNNLTLSGSLAKTTTGATVNGILSMEGTATTTGAAPSYGAAATLQYKGAAAQTTGTEFPAIWTGSGGVILANTSGNAVAFSAGKAIAARLTINAGAHVSLGANNNSAASLTLGGADQAGGIYGSSSSSAPPANQSAFFAGTGILTVGIITPTKLVFAAAPATGTAGTAFSVTVQAQDANGNPGSPTSSTTITLTKASGAGTLSGTLTGNIGTSASSVTISTPVYSRADVMTLTAAATAGMTSLTPVTSGSITFSAGAATKLAYTSAPSNAIAGTPFSVTVQSQDANGNPSNPTGDTLITLSKASGAGTMSGTLTGTLVASGNSVTIPAAVYSMADTMTLTASRTSGGAALTPVTSGNILFAVGPPAKLAFTTQPGGGTAGTAWATQPVVAVQDAGGNTVTTNTSTVTVAILNNAGPGGVLSGAVSKAAVAGVANFSTNALRINKSGVGYTLAATDGLLTSATSSGFNITAGAVSAAQSTVSAFPSSVRADGAAASTITVTLLDTNSNPVAGKAVALASSRGATDTISAASGASDAAGVVTFSVKSSTTGSPVFTATDTTDARTVSTTATVTFAANPPADAGTSTVSASPLSVWANGTNTSTVTVRLKEIGNTAVAGKTVSLASSRGAADTITPASGVSSASGAVAFTAKSSTAGPAIFTATDVTDSVTLSQTAAVNFVEPTAGGAHPTNDCATCHLTHNALGPDLTSIAGNANLCLSCHTAGGLASSSAFSSADQAQPWPGLPAGASPDGSSHRWDSGVAGHVTLLSTNPASTGTLQPGGAFTGAYAKTYIITVTNAGSAGAARFNWAATAPGGAGTNILSGTNVALNQGVTVTFIDGTGTSFHVSDQWSIQVRADLQAPTNNDLLIHLDHGLASCSTCHNEHSQANPPFDPNAPASGVGRRYMRISNNVEQLCADCHAPRVVTNAAAGSHPVGILITTGLYYKITASLPLEGGTGKVRCLTCHTMHHAAADDGDLLRLTNGLALCIDCHKLANTAAPGAHFVQTNPATLWPGAQYGSTFPQRTNMVDRGTCVNCHAPHGWPVTTNTASHYPDLLVDFEENVCFTCHDANGPAIKQVQSDFTKTRHHPVANAEQRPGRKVECESCHNSHKALAGSRDYTVAATASRNAVTNNGALAGVSGVAVDYTGLGNFAAPAPGRYATNVAATLEYQICFKCHSALAWNFGTAPVGLSPNGAVATPVQTDLAQEFSPMNMSGHPIVTGLDNYPNSLAVGATPRRGLQAGAMRAPWTNVGQQTMMCSDCHNTDALAPAAQGPHGSATQFILRSPNGNNWPNPTSFASSWCVNCHVDNVSDMDGNHGTHHGSACYTCHIVIPHGGKVSRLIATATAGLPARYAWGNNTATVGMTLFTKAANNGYTENNNCRTSCGHHSGGTGNESW